MNRALADQDLLDQAAAAPWEHSFFGLMRRLAARDARERGAPPLGHALRPSQEGLRIGQQASLGFAPREIAAVRQQGEQVQVLLFGGGLLGPNGPLPLHVTEWVRERSESRRDSTLADFLDLFHHRYFTLFYRAWAQGQAAAGLDRPGDEGFTRYVARLCGDEPAQVQDSALAPHARWASAAHRVRASQDPDGLASSVSHHFGVPVRVQEFVPQWMTLPPQERSVLGGVGPSVRLGQGAVAGQAVLDRQSRFRLILGPLTQPAYLRLTPQGFEGVSDLPALVEMVRSFLGLEYDWEIELLVQPQAASACRLGDSARLGWTSWLAGAGATPPRGMVLEPERHFEQARRRAASPA